MTRYDVFISYRRDGGAETARLLRIALSQRGYRAFLDVDDLASGHFDERLLFRSLNDPRIGPNTLPARDFSSRWENHDQHVALFIIVGLPVMFSSTFVAWYVLYAMAEPVGELIAPVWLLVIAAAYHLWGVRLLRLCHDHLTAEQA